MFINKNLVLAVPTVLAFVSFNTFADAGATQDIVLSTDVASVCTIEANSLTYSPDLTTGEDGTTIATITEICNDADGYTVTFTSANSGKLQNDDVPGEEKDYEITYGSIDEKKLNRARTESYNSGTASNAVLLKLDLAADSGVIAAGTWSDTITATVAVID